MELILEELQRLTPYTGQATDEKKILDLLQQLTNKISKTNDDDNRSALTGDSFKLIESILDVTPNVRTASLRFLRNAVAFNPINQNVILERTMLLQWAGKFMLDSSDNNTVNLESKKLCLQFLCNCIVNNQPNAEFVASTANYIPRYISLKMNEAGYLLNTILILLPHFSKVVFEDPSLFQVILDNTDIESNVILLETLSSNSDFLSTTYGQLTEVQQLSYIHFLSTSQCKINLEFFTSLFKSKADSILKSNLDKLESEFQEITALLELISSSSHINLLCDDKALVTTVIHLLQLTNQSALFSPIEKLSKVTEEYQNHPAFLFKANLIRLLGNLAHNHRDNQILIGASCLEIILNCTKIDALNPFITQWSILAIRNLLHTNPENQSFVANLKLQSSAYSKILFEEFGITVQANVDDNSIKIVPK